MWFAKRWKPRAAQAEKVAGASPLAELVAKFTNRAAPSLTPDAKLDDELNLSSLKRVELFSALEDRYQVDLGETRYSEVQTVGELEKLLANTTTGDESSTSRAR